MKTIVVAMALTAMLPLTTSAADPADVCPTPSCRAPASQPAPVACQNLNCAPAPAPQAAPAQVACDGWMCAPAPAPQAAPAQVACDDWLCGPATHSPPPCEDPDGCSDGEMNGLLLAMADVPGSERGDVASSTLLNYESFGDDALDRALGEVRAAPSVQVRGRGLVARPPPARLAADVTARAKAGTLRAETLALNGRRCRDGETARVLWVDSKHRPALLGRVFGSEVELSFYDAAGAVLGAWRIDAEGEVLSTIQPVAPARAVAALAAGATCAQAVPSAR
jgi:hypothetical protein